MSIATKLQPRLVEFNGSQWEVIISDYPGGQIKLEMIGDEPARCICCTAEFDMLNFGATGLTVIKDYGDSEGTIAALEAAGFIERKAFKTIISGYEMVLVKVLI